MVDQARANAEALRSRLAKRLQELEAERAATEKQLSEVTAFLRAADQYASIDPDETSVPAFTGGHRETVEKRPRNPRREDVIAIVIEGLESAGKPMQLRELYELVTSRGIVLHGTDPQAVFGTMLWRGGQDGVLVNLRGLGYWPAHLPNEAAGYTPPEQ